MIERIAIIGSGVMGSNIALSFAAKGYTVIVNDIKEEFLAKAKGRMIENLSILLDEGELNEESVQTALANISYSVHLDEAAREADFIIEAIPEKIELKSELFQKLEALMKPDTIVASNTSTFPISRLMEKASFADRMIITHFFNPAHIVPLVEIVRHRETKAEIVEEIVSLIRSIGKEPILLKKEISGFIANRLQTALMREAFYLLKEGAATARDIDTAITAGPGFRWAFTGPIEIADFGGLDTWQSVFENVARELDQSTGAPEVIRDLVRENKLGTKTGQGIYPYDECSVSEKLNERDRLLIKLRRVKK
jgi:3-hydroxybutyryl-CoA dehydrogenase